MVNFRTLINSSILNSEEWIRFMGDSEYIGRDGVLRLGYWVFESIQKDAETDLNLDSEIQDENLNGFQSFLVKNDNGTVCKITLIYGDGNNGND